MVSRPVLQQPVIDAVDIRSVAEFYRELLGLHYRAGDELALAALDSFSTWLGRGLAMVADILDPAQIVLGGGVSDDADLYLADARAAMEANIVGAGYRPLPEILCAELGSRAGMIGVADLAREPH